jgi:hypothetical protein
MADESKKSLEMRVAEIEDKLSKIHITEDEMKAFQKVSGLIGGPATAASPCIAAQAASPCIAAQAVSPCIAAHAASPCIASQGANVFAGCIVSDCFACSGCWTECWAPIRQCVRQCCIFQATGPFRGGGGGGFSGGGFGSLGG